MGKQLQTTEEAIETVKDNNYGYYELGLNFAIKWVAEKMQPFTSEDLSKDMYLILGPPEEPRVLGAIVRKLSKEGRIRFNGYSKYKAKQGHGKPVTVWIGREYSIKQSQNAKKDQTLNLFDNN